MTMCASTGKIQALGLSNFDSMSLSVQRFSSSSWRILFLNEKLRRTTGVHSPAMSPKLNLAGKRVNSVVLSYSMDLSTETFTQNTEISSFTICKKSAFSYLDVFVSHSTI